MLLGALLLASVGATPAQARERSGLALQVGYEAALPSSVVSGAQFEVEVRVRNLGTQRWAAEGAHAPRLSSHWYRDGMIALWDGPRTDLGAALDAGQSRALRLVVQAPAQPGRYELELDLVVEGQGWASQNGTRGPRAAVNVEHGVRLEGGGWGHSLGLSQWGAQGLAQGVTGRRYRGEEIIAHYYPGTQIERRSDAPVRVLLSWPSEACDGSTILGLAQMASSGGLRVVALPSGVELTRTAPHQRISLHADGSQLRLMRRLDSERVEWVWSGDGRVRVEPLDSDAPIAIDQKGRAYRGSLEVMVREHDRLRVVDHVDRESYVRGVLPLEMPASWEQEALVAQAYAARSYAGARRAASSHFDLYDDTKDQCYGGQSAERSRSDAAVRASAGGVLTYHGEIVTAYFSSSNGGATADGGCVWSLQRSGAGYRCGTGPGYLVARDDPADLLARDPAGVLNPNARWSTVRTAAQIEAAVRAMGDELGSFRELDLGERTPHGQVVSVRVRGSGGEFVYPADRFLRGALGLRSIMVRQVAP